MYKRDGVCLAVGLYVLCCLDPLAHLLSVIMLAQQGQVRSTGCKSVALSPVVDPLTVVIMVGAHLACAVLDVWSVVLSFMLEGDSAMASMLANGSCVKFHMSKDAGLDGSPSM